MPEIKIPLPHGAKQEAFVECRRKRQIIRTGRRFGKTYGAAIKGLKTFVGECPICKGKGCSECKDGMVEPKRVLYAAPTQEQVGKFWFEIVKGLQEAIDAGYYKKDESEKFIEIPKTEVRIKAKTAWNANTLRGDYADLLIFDEFQLMNEDAWDEVGQPMLLDNNGTAVFIYTPPSLKSEGVSKAKDPRHASKLFKKALLDTTGRWETFHFTSFDNPTLSTIALNEISTDMSLDAYRREIMAEDDEIQTSWLVYSKFNEDQIIKRFDIPDNWNVVSGHDFGQANPAALFAAQVKLPLPDGAPSNIRYGDWVIFREYAPGAGFSASQHVDRFKEIRTDVLSVGGNLTSEGEIRQNYTIQGWSIQEPRLKGVNTQIDRVIGLMESNEIFIMEDLYGLLAQISNCMWIIEENKPTNKIQGEAKYHLLASLRYMCTLMSIKTIRSQKMMSVSSIAF